MDAAKPKRHRTELLKYHVSLALDFRKQHSADFDARKNAKFGISKAARIGSIDEEKHNDKLWSRARDLDLELQKLRSGPGAQALTLRYVEINSTFIDILLSEP